MISRYGNSSFGNSITKRLRKRMKIFEQVIGTIKLIIKIYALLIYAIIKILNGLWQTLLIRVLFYQLIKHVNTGFYLIRILHKTLNGFSCYKCFLFYKEFAIFSHGISVVDYASKAYTHTKKHVKISC